MPPRAAKTHNIYSTSVSLSKYLDIVHNSLHTYLEFSPRSVSAGSTSGFHLRIHMNLRANILPFPRRRIPRVYVGPTHLHLGPTDDNDNDNDNTRPPRPPLDLLLLLIPTTSKQ